MATFNDDIFLIGGSKSWYRYSDEPSKVWVLLNRSSGATTWRDDIVPPLIGARMWHACTIAAIGQKVTQRIMNTIKKQDKDFSIYCVISIYSVGIFQHPLGWTTSCWRV